MSLLNKLETALVKAKSGEKLDFEADADKAKNVRVYLVNLKNKHKCNAMTRVVDGKVIVFKL